MAPKTNIFPFLWASLVAQMTKSLPAMQEGNGNPLRYSGLENSMDRGAWQATVHGVTELDMTECLHFFSLPGP